MSETNLYTTDDLKAARAIRKLLESRLQMDRIRGRCRYWEMEKRLGQEAMKQIAERINGEKLP